MKIGRVVEAVGSLCPKGMGKEINRHRRVNILKNVCWCCSYYQDQKYVLPFLTLAAKAEI